MDDTIIPRTTGRESVMLAAFIADERGANATRHRVRNLSQTGVCVDQADHLMAGQRYVLTVGHAEPVTGTVMWVRGVLAGVRFDRPIVVAEARTRRPAGTGATAPVGAPAAGWMANMTDAYRVRGAAGCRPALHRS